MKFAELFNRMLRLPLSKALELVDKYKEEKDFDDFAQAQKVMDLLAHKSNIRRAVEDRIREDYMLLAMMIRGNNPFSRGAFEEMKHEPMTVWIECIGVMEPNQIMDLLKYYAKEFPSNLVETCIINLPDNMQVEAIVKYKDYIKVDEGTFNNFYFSVCREARSKLTEIYSYTDEDELMLELEDSSEEEIVRRLTTENIDIPINELVEFILLNFKKIKSFNKFFRAYKDRFVECPTELFELLLTRYKYVGSKKGSYYDEYEDYEEDEKILSDTELFELFKDKFHSIGLTRTLSVFDNKVQYGPNEFNMDIITRLMDVAYEDAELSSYVNDNMIVELIKKFTEECNNKSYSVEDLESLVFKIRNSERRKLIHDDYIEAIIACGKLLKEGKINNTNPLYLELRDMFTKDTISGCKKDGTYEDSISLNGIFYRLAKGSIPFDNIYMTKTYKGLIYLTKCGLLPDDADYITKYLTDEQLAKLNISPALKIKNEINKDYSNVRDKSFIDRMALQLYCYFGKEKAKYLLENNTNSSNMEFLFDRLKYNQISVDEQGNPIVNEDLVDFLFGRGQLTEENTVINRMNRGEIPDFNKWFSEFCNTFENVRKQCNGVLSINRIINHFSELKLPIKLKPDEYNLRIPLKEMNTNDIGLLNKAIALCRESRNRVYSSIPKVEGNIGDFRYEILDLDDPLAVCVGYLSHCCFVVEGISYSSLKHSMLSHDGRTFVVFYKGQFIAQSWVWRNGDVICFDSVEAGSDYHDNYKDNIGITNVYKKAAEEILDISSYNEDPIQCVKAVTIGRSDYILKGMNDFIEYPPVPQGNGYLYLSDSRDQRLLAGEMPENPRYEVVGAQYKDRRKPPVTLTSTEGIDVDIVDSIANNIKALRYRINNIEEPIDINEYSKVISADGWYILVSKNGSIESGALDIDERITEEYDEYLKREKGIEENEFDKEETQMRLRPLSGINRKGDDK